MTDTTIHIHAGGTDPCAACGDAYSVLLYFITDVGQWNRTKDRCSQIVVLPDYTTVTRDDRRTSALDDERPPDWRKDPERNT